MADRRSEGSEDGEKPPKITRLAAIDSPEARLNPYPYFERKRRKEPVRYDDVRQVWDLFRFEDIYPILLDDGESFSVPSIGIFEQISDTALEPMKHFFANFEPSEHQEVRSSVNKFFRRDALENYRDNVRQIAEEQLDEATENGRRFDFATDFAAPIPAKVMFSLLGIPREDWGTVRTWTRALVSDADVRRDTPIDEEERKLHMKRLFHYIGQLVEYRKENPGTDILSLLAGKGGSEAGFSEERVTGMCVNMLSAGILSPSLLLSNTLWCLEEQDLTSQLLDGELNHRSLVEEVLRYRSPQQVVPRNATRDVEIGDKRIEAGETVLLWLGAANRDGERFRDASSFDPERSPNPNIAFGNGRHRCLAASLSHLLLDVSLNTLEARLEQIDVDLRSLKPFPGNIFYGPRNLTVSTTPRV